MSTPRTALRMPLELRDAIDREAGEGGRSKWIIDQCYKGLGINEPGSMKQPPRKATSRKGEVNPRPKR